MDDFKNRLKKLRKEKNLYQKDLAEIVGVSDGAIGMYETGKRSPDKQILDRLANYFDVSIDYLLGRTEERFPADKLKENLLNDPEMKASLTELIERKELQRLIKSARRLNAKKINKLIYIIETFEDLD